MKRLSLLLLLLGCDETTPPRAPGDAGVSTETPALTEAQRRNRLALDLIGRRPTPEEQDRPLESLIDEWLNTSAFARRVGTWFGEALHQRIDRYAFTATDYGLTESAVPRFDAAVGSEVEHLVTFVVLNDLPASAMLTEAHTFVDPVLVQAWDLEEVNLPDRRLPPGTVAARYRDGRPAAGILSTNAFYWRHPSTVENANRGRANAITRGLLCEDYLERAIDFPEDIDLSDSESIRAAIRTQPACLGCHATLDPLASYLWGFMYRQELAQNWTIYHSEQERDWRLETRRPPGLFGVPGDTLAQLPRQLAADSRFAACATRHLFEHLLGRPATPADAAALAVHREVWLASDGQLDHVVRSIIESPAYWAEAGTTPFGPGAQGLTERLITPEQLGSTIEELTGYRLRVEGRDALHTDALIRTIAGGSDRGAATSMSPGLLLVQRRLAEGAARFALENATFPLGAWLAEQDLDAPPTADALKELGPLILAHPLEADARTELAALGQAVYAAEPDAHAAWHAVLVALMADPLMLVY